MHAVQCCELLEMVEGCHQELGSLACLAAVLVIIRMVCRRASFGFQAASGVHMLCACCAACTWLEATKQQAAVAFVNLLWRFCCLLYLLGVPNSSTVFLIDCLGIAPLNPGLLPGL